ncbi:MAG: tRNA guanosine(34) transglycosylase Tgt [bacterium]|nr:tRNA guanosine(34) transglycosylase Tgt [bacterium]
MAHEPQQAAGSFTLRARDGGARRGTLRLAHGCVETPVFMPVGTAATVKGLTPAQLEGLGAQIVLANTYHLSMRPGLEPIVDCGGLHRFMGWQRPILTDSGGFQVFSLEGRRKLDDEGVVFHSHIDGSRHRFTPEGVVAFQEALGVDVAMVLDVCVRLPAKRAELERALTLTTAWARRSLESRRCPAATALFAIVQGGLERDLRAQSARELAALDLPGYGIGGLSVGETRAEMFELARYTAALLPEAKPRYLMGVGTVVDVILAIEGGIDMFDCVYPTRCGRNARAITRSGELNLRMARFKRDTAPVDQRCGCYVCANFSRAYLSHLFRAGEMLAAVLLSYHNLAVLLDLTAEARDAIERGAWEAWRDEALRTFGDEQAAALLSR